MTNRGRARCSERGEHQSRYDAWDCDCGQVPGGFLIPRGCDCGKTNLGERHERRCAYVAWARTRNAWIVEHPNVRPPLQSLSPSVMVAAPERLRPAALARCPRCNSRLVDSGEVVQCLPCGWEDYASMDGSRLLAPSGAGPLYQPPVHEGRRTGRV